MSESRDAITDRGSLVGRVALVSAAAGAGIGQAIALCLANAGADLVLTDRHERRAVEVADQLRDATGRHVVPVRLDVTSEESVASAFEQARDELGPADILVNNAGLGHVAPIWELDLVDWHKVVNVNLTGAFLTMRAALPDMIEARSGAIVNIASIAGWVSWAAPGGEGVYAAAKAGVMALTRTTAHEVAEYGIRVNGVAPGLTPNPFLAKSQPENFLKELEAKIPIKRASTPSDIADCVHFLVSDYSRTITGEIINVSGGLFMRP